MTARQIYFLMLVVAPTVLASRYPRSESDDTVSLPLWRTHVKRSSTRDGAANTPGGDSVRSTFHKLTSPVTRNVSSAKQSAEPQPKKRKDFTRNSYHTAMSEGLDCARSSFQSSQMARDVCSDEQAAQLQHKKINTSYLPPLMILFQRSNEPGQEFLRQFEVRGPTTESRKSAMRAEGSTSSPSLDEDSLLEAAQVLSAFHSFERINNIEKSCEHEDIRESCEHERDIDDSYEYEDIDDSYEYEDIDDSYEYEEDTGDSSKCKEESGDSCKCEEESGDSCECEEESGDSCECEEDTDDSCECEEDTDDSCECEEESGDFCECDEDTDASCECEEESDDFCECEEDTDDSCKCEEASSDSLGNEGASSDFFEHEASGDEYENLSQKSDVVYPEFPNISAHVTATDAFHLDRSVVDECHERMKYVYSIDSQGFYLNSWQLPENVLIDPKTGEKLSKTFTWVEARNQCRKRCMDLVSFETSSELGFYSAVFDASNLPFVWTSGRICDYKECANLSELKPLNVNGWIWTATGERLPPTNAKPPQWSFQPWSPSGISNDPQPDNAEFAINGKNESCLALMNNVYGDRIAYHDVACYHKKYFTCEDSPALIDMVYREHGVKLIRPHTFVN